LVGPNGAGKSTLLRLLAGLTTPTRGSVRLDERDLAILEPSERARLIGLVPQQFTPCWDYSARDIIELAGTRAPVRRQPLAAIAKRLELGAFLERRWSTLSGGERARVTLGAVLVCEPPVLLADEPGASLDVRHRVRLLELLASLARERVCLVALHDLELAAAYCERLIVLADGRVQIDGSTVQVARSTDLDRVFGVQFQRVPVNVRSGPLLPIPRD
jgi:iron complex transport system ATP-binding protein